MWLRGEPHEQQHVPVPLTERGHPGRQSPGAIMGSVFCQSSSYGDSGRHRSGSAEGPGGVAQYGSREGNYLYIDDAARGVAAPWSLEEGSQSASDWQHLWNDDGTDYLGEEAMSVDPNSSSGPRGEPPPRGRPSQQASDADRGRVCTVSTKARPLYPTMTPLTGPRRKQMGIAGAGTVSQALVDEEGAPYLTVKGAARRSMGAPSRASSGVESPRSGGTITVRSVVGTVRILNKEDCSFTTSSDVAGSRAERSQADAGFNAYSSLEHDFSANGSVADAEAEDVDILRPPLRGAAAAGVGSLVLPDRVSTDVGTDPGSPASAAGDGSSGGFDWSGYGAAEAAQLERPDSARSILGPMLCEGGPIGRGSPKVHTMHNAPLLASLDSPKQSRPYHNERSTM